MNKTIYFPRTADWIRAEVRDTILQDITENRATPYTQIGIEQSIFTFYWIIRSNEAFERRKGHE